MYSKVINKWNQWNKNRLKHKVNIVTQNSLPYMEATINNEIKTNCLIDTGASKDIISKAFYDKLSHRKVSKLYPCNDNLYAANNQLMNQHGYCFIKIKIGNFTWKIKMLVIEDIKWDIVLGTNFVTHSQMILNLSQNKAYFRFKPNEYIPVYRQEPLLKAINNLEVNIGCPEAEANIQALIKKFPNVFTKKLGQALDLEVQLKLTDHTPVNIRPYFMSPPTVAKVKTILDDWLKQGIIVPSTSAYASPAFLTKKDRLVVNYTELNKKLEKISFPLGDLSNSHQFLSGARYFTVIDLNKSFLQCPISKDSQDLTSFCTVFGKFKFTRVPFGLHVGSAVLSSYLDKVLKDIKFKYVINFCDDILIYSQDLKSHLQHVEEVVTRLSKNRLTVNIEKAKFCCEQISFLGNLIKNGSVTIDPERTRSIHEFPAPKNARQVAQFLGATNFFAKYVPGYADLCEPLNRLRRKKVKFVWSPECQESFVKLKNAIMNPPVLQIADFSKQFIVMSDASGIAAGGCLMQENDNKELLPIAYYSRKFTPAELNYTIYEKEALAAIVCIERWHEFLEVRPFKLITDNQALSYVLNHKRKVGRLGRWIERISNLPFEVEFRSSSDNSLADALSRMFESENECDARENNISNESAGHNRECEIINNSEHHANVIADSESSLSQTQKPINKYINIVDRTCRNKTNDNVFQLISELPLAFKDIVTHQSKDEETQRIVQSVKNNQHNNSYYIKNDVLMYKNNDRSKGRIFLPLNLVDLIFAYFHKSVIGGHLGINRSQRKINQYFYRPDLNVTIRQLVKNCDICKMSKNTQRKYEGELISVPTRESMECIFIDLIGKLPRSKMGHQYILVVVDSFSKYLWLIPLRDCKSSEICDKLQRIVFNNFSPPRKIVSDNASYFTSAYFSKFIFNNCIEHRRIAPYRACGNQSERHIRNISASLRCYHYDCQNTWDENLGNLQICFNTAVNESTKFTAFELMFNHACNNALSNLWRLNDLLAENVSPEACRDNLKRAIINVKASIAKNKNRQRYNERNVKHPFVKNSLVWIKTHYLSNKANKFTAKLAPKYIGVYRIIYFLSPVTCLVQKTTDVSDVRKVHIIDLKMN